MVAKLEDSLFFYHIRFRGHSISLVKELSRFLHPSGLPASLATHGIDKFWWLHELIR